MQLDQISETKPMALPRVYREFIGIGHELENHKRQRKSIEMKQRAMQNRVLHLQKQKKKTMKDIKEKKKKLQEIFSKKERQQYQAQQKARQKMLKEQELQRLKRHNQLMRAVHKNNVQSHVQQIKMRNHSDYSRIRQQRIDGEKRKNLQKHVDLSEKKQQWMTLNISRQKGKMKVDKFFKKKNKEYLEFYKSRIQDEDIRRSQKLNNIKFLEAQQQKLKQQLQNSTIRASQMVQLINRASRTLSPLNTRSIEAELFADNNNSKKTMAFTQRQTTVRDQSEETVTNSKVRNNKGRDEIQENIELAEDQSDKGGFRMVHRRNRNRHANRYRQYEAF